MLRSVQLSHGGKEASLVWMWSSRTNNCNLDDEDCHCDANNDHAYACDVEGKSDAQLLKSKPMSFLLPITAAPCPCSCKFSCSSHTAARDRLCCSLMVEFDVPAIAPLSPAPASCVPAPP